MSFFDDVLGQPERPREPQPAQPGWFGPPSDELPGVARAGGFLYKGQQKVVALKLVEVYSTGCLLDLVWSVRRGSESDQEWREVVEEGYNHPRSSLDTRAGLELGIALADGRKAVAAIRGPLGLRRRRRRNWPRADNPGRWRWEQQFRIRPVHRPVLVVAVAFRGCHDGGAVAGIGHTGKLTRCAGGIAR